MKVIYWAKTFHKTLWFLPSFHCFCFLNIYNKFSSEIRATWLQQKIHNKGLKNLVVSIFPNRSRSNEFYSLMLKAEATFEEPL